MAQYYNGLVVVNHQIIQWHGVFNNEECNNESNVAQYCNQWRQ
jgi:hypothetical protein